MYVAGKKATIARVKEHRSERHKTRRVVFQALYINWVKHFMADVKAWENSKAGNKLINELQYVKFIYIQCGHSCNSLCCGAGLPLYLAKSTWKDATTSEFAVSLISFVLLQRFLFHMNNVEPCFTSYQREQKHSWGCDDMWQCDTGFEMALLILADVLQAKASRQA